MDSNNGYRIQEQLEWLDSVLLVTTSDTNIDFVFAQLHHPHHSELWPEGNTSFTGDVIENWRLLVQFRKAIYSFLWSYSWILKRAI